MRARAIVYYFWDCLGIWVVVMAALFAGALMLDWLGAGGGYYDLAADLVLPGLGLALTLGLGMWLGARLESGRLGKMREGIARGKAGAICAGGLSCPLVKFETARANNAESVAAIYRRGLNDLRGSAARARLDSDEERKELNRVLVAERAEHERGLRELKAEVGRTKELLLESTREVRELSCRLYLAGREACGAELGMADAGDVLAARLCEEEALLAAREDRIVELECQLEWALQGGGKAKRARRRRGAVWSRAASARQSHGVGKAGRK